VTSVRGRYGTAGTKTTLRCPLPPTVQLPGSDGVSEGIGDPGAIGAENVTLIPDVPFTPVRPRWGE
jgi:hypothetical protein